MSEIFGRKIIYTADDEMPDCMNCVHCDEDFDCSRNCGAEHGWYGYKRIERLDNEQRKTAD
jgi:hypothetical protein